MKSSFLVVFLFGVSTACWLALSGFNLEYDSPGIGGLLFWIGQVITFPFWASSELLFALHGGKAFPYHDTMSLILAWFIMALILIALRIKKKGTYGNRR